MKTAVLTIVAVFSMLGLPLNLLAATEHTCVYRGFDFKVKTDREKDISVTVFKDAQKVIDCKMKVTSYYDGKRGASLCELIRFEKISCDVPDGKAASGIAISDQGFMTMCPGDKLSSVDLMDNVQPLRCKVTAPTEGADKNR